jgi:glycosyltransferase involved in cell wall biosynthesis
LIGDDTVSANLRILAVGNMYPPQHAGGYELAWHQAMHRARELGHRTRVLTSGYREDPRRAEEDPDVHRTLRWYWDLERYEFPRLNLAQRLRLERHNAAELRRHLERFRPHVVTWWSMGCMSLSMIEQVRRAGFPAVFVVHDDWLVYGWEHDRWIRTWSGPRRSVVGRLVEPVCGIPVRVAVNDSGPFVFNSRYTLERARRAGVSSRAMTIVHPGIDDRFQAQVPPPAWGWRLAYVGRIDRQKGVDTAVAALEHLPKQSTLTVWGTGDERYVAELKSLATRIGAGDRVRFEGFAAGEQLRSAYADADAVVFPVRWNEPFGLVPLEAMGVGRPVVTTSRGGTSEFVRDGENALVFEADDARTLAASVRRLAGDERLRARLLAEGRRTAARYSEAEFAERTVDQIVQVVERPAGARPVRVKA